MADAIVLLALSQLVCLGGLGYLYLQLQDVRKRLGQLPRPTASRPPANGDRLAAARSYASPAQRSTNAAELLARLHAEGKDLASLARRLNRSEEEIRLLLRNRGVLP